MKEVYDKFGLEATTRDFIGHSMALYTTDEYINQKGMAEDAIQRIRLYVNSMARYGKSPYIYPLYGLGELPQGFARLSAIYGGTYMLNTDVDEVLKDASGKVTGIKATMKERDQEGPGMKFETKTKKILADPSYFPGKARPVGHLLKAICILNHPIDKTDNSDSVQLILPQSQIGRKNDIYIAMVSWAHNVAPKGYYIAIVSTIAEGDSNHHLELQPGLDRLGRIEEKFMGPPIPIYEPLESGVNDNIFLSKSYDATSHFETTTGMCHTKLKIAMHTRLTAMQTTSRTSTGGQRARNSRSRASGKDRTLLRKNRGGTGLTKAVSGVHWMGVHAVEIVETVYRIQLSVHECGY